jgi:3-oxoacyl-[acyl-carrier-protein] synthase-3
MEAKKVLLINADVFSHTVSKRDRNLYPLSGDAATLTVLENGPVDMKINFAIKTDGARREMLTVPAGGSRLPFSEETAREISDQDGNYRSRNHFHMDGTAVFQFVQSEVPPLIDGILNFSGLTKDSVDFFLFHQPNRFMLAKLAKRMGIPSEKMPMNLVETYGNPGGPSIPLLIAHNFSDMFKKGEYVCCLSGFGSGLTWSAITMKIGNMDFCELLESEL